jgi:Domain of unknown function (DUF6985)
VNSNWLPGDSECVQIERGKIWEHVQVGDEPMVTRSAYGDQRVYISFECSRDWEPEHGLQIVFKEGRIVNKVGPYDGHLTNAAAFADDKLENVVYRSG